MATAEAIDVVMPQMGVSVSEGTITKWLKQEGEQVEADEPLLEISTDKVDTEVPSPGSGTLSQILVQEGQTVEVGTKLAVIGGAGAAAEPQVAAHEPPVAEPPPAPAPTPAAEAPEPEPAPAAAAAGPAPAPAQQIPAQASTNGKTFVSPVVAKIASEHGVDPTSVQGTGRGGRVTKKDILAFIEAGPPTAAPEPAVAAAPEAPVVPEAPRPRPQLQPRSHRLHRPRSHRRRHPLPPWLRRRSRNPSATRASSR